MPFSLPFPTARSRWLYIAAHQFANGSATGVKWWGLGRGSRVYRLRRRKNCRVSLGPAMVPRSMGGKIERRNRFFLKEAPAFF